jgi:diguanylate cyclase (GGDEF)-like protein
MEFAGRLISVCYPVMDVALVAVAVRLVGVVPLRRPAYAFLTAGLCSLLVADTIYGVLNSAGTFQTGGFADLFWLGFYVLIAVAALQPPMSGQQQDRKASSSQLSRTRLVMLCLITLTVPTIDMVWGRPGDKTLTAVTSMVMFVLVLGRLGGLMGVVLRSEQRARLDTLTGLANRLLFDEHVARSVERGGDGVISVLFVDLDDFKVVNDSIGHQAGDDLLIAIADRLRACVRGDDLVARLSGDEFAVLLESAVDQHDAIGVVRRLQVDVRCSSRRASASWSNHGRWWIVRRPCCRPRTWRCTGPRARARAGSRSSTTTCTRNSSICSTSRVISPSRSSVASSRSTTNRSSTWATNGSCRSSR